ncbi:MAG TPA: DUF3237 domain-containing protein [Caldimonas sp.]|nr:DUF3237 domain-containing protein [Caldimonas sp.]
MKDVVPDHGRRQVMCAAITAPFAEAAQADTTAWRATDPAIAGVSTGVPLVLPQTEFVYEALFDLAPTLQLGASPYGERRIVPITGGRFQGPRFAGRVLPGGADRQLVRRDGAVSLDATYELETDDGVVVSVRNRVLSRPPKDAPNAPRYAFSTLDIVAPDGRYGWLNDWVYVGTLHSLRPKPNVLIRVYKVV